MGETKQRILDVSLELFSERGFSGVSIRDICKLVQIKESSVYYHFKNKQDILDALLLRFQKKAAGMMERLESALQAPPTVLEEGAFFAVCNSFFEEYLMDEFCNKMLRLMMIEGFHNEKVRKIYDHWAFSEPLRFQSSVFALLGQVEAISKKDSQYLAVSYYAPIYLYAQKWLFSGELSEDNKNAFRAAAYKHIQMFFAEMGGS